MKKFLSILFAAVTLAGSITAGLPVYAGKGSPCPVCLEDLDEEQNVAHTTYCRHEFHKGCIYRWLREHAICPVCRGAAGDLTMGFAPERPEPLREGEKLDLQQGVTRRLAELEDLLTRRIQRYAEMFELLNSIETEQRDRDWTEHMVQKSPCESFATPSSFCEEVEKNSRYAVDMTALSATARVDVQSFVDNIARADESIQYARHVAERLGHPAGHSAWGYVFTFGGGLNGRERAIALQERVQLKDLSPQVQGWLAYIAIKHEIVGMQSAINTLKDADQLTKVGAQNGWCLR